MNDVSYPVVLTYEDGVIYLEAPDVPGAYSDAENFDSAIRNAKEVISLSLYDLEDYPKPSQIKDLKDGLKDNQEVIYVSLWLPYEFSQIKTVYKKKTLSIPNWLDALAVQKNINFSQALQRALKEELGID